MAQDSRVGTTIAGYRIESVLGRGGMGVVYLAEQVALGRKVALKVLAPELASDPRFRERFLRESRLAASIEDPNILPVHEAGESGGALFIAMRYVRGTDLRRLIDEEGPLPPDRVVSVLTQVASALDAAHAEGLIHRDVKPGNVLVVPGTPDKVYLADFGLTRRASSDSGLTGTGQFVGTLDYAAPEQFTGEPLTPRTDVYSLGCVAYECLVGEPPFPRDREAAVLHAHLHEPPPKPTAKRPELPEAIDAVVAKAMAKKPSERYGSAGELAGAASASLRTARPAAPVSARMARRGRPLVLGLGMLGAGVALIAFLLTRSPGTGATAPPPPSGSAVSTKPSRPTVPPIGSVAEFDPATGSISRQVPEVPSISFSASHMAWGEGSVWVVNPIQLADVDPSSESVKRSLPFGEFMGGNASLARLAVGFRTVWVSGSGQPGIVGRPGYTGRIYRIDPATAELLHPPVALPGNPVDVAVDGTSVWTALDDGTVVQIDPETLRIVGKVDTKTAPFAIAAGAGSIWVADEFDGVVVRIDPRSRHLIARIPFAGRLDAIAAGPEGVWILDGFAGTATPIDLDRNRLGGAIPVGDKASGIAVGLGAVWVSDYGGDLFKIDPATRQSTPVRVGNPLAAVAVDDADQTVWVLVQIPPAG
jgi:serine/threonine protein kinase